MPAAIVRHIKKTKKAEIARIFLICALDYMGLYFVDPDDGGSMAGCEKTYAVQYTISVLTGSYAHKYSVILYNAGRFEALFAMSQCGLKGLAADTKRSEFDAYETFQALMKVLKFVVKNRDRAFCAGIEREADGEKTLYSAVSDADEQGEFSLRAYGESGICVRDGIETPFETIEGKSGHYRAMVASFEATFKDDLMNMANLCEETMAKDARLIAQTVPNDTPAPPPLFQL